MASDGLTVDDCAFPGASIEGPIRRLAALTLQGPRRLRPYRVLKRARGECAGGEEISIAALVTKGKVGDSAAQEALIKHYQARIAGFVFACVSDSQAVEDLCQTIFFKMLMGLPRLKTEEKFESWLFRIARNTCFDHLRKRRLRGIFLPWSEASDSSATPACLITDSLTDHRADSFRQALMRLPKRQRELVALLQDDRLSYEKLAEITNTSVGSVKSRLFRARRQLRKYMQDER